MDKPIIKSAKSNTLKNTKIVTADRNRKSTKEYQNSQMKKISSQITPKPPPRPRPGQKRFLASVLKILSKSSTGTQYSDNFQKKEKDSKKPYRSKILNDCEDQIDFIQYKKDLIQTPSLYSEESNTKEFNTKELNLPRLVIDEEEIRVKKQENIDLLHKQLTEGLKEEKKTFAEDNGLYNFFVDLLETTLSDKTEFGESETASRVKFEIDENVANKLKVNNYDEEEKLSKKFKYLPNEHQINNLQSPSLLFTQIPPKLKKRRIKSKSFDFLKVHKEVPRSTKKVFKKNKKEELLNLLKEELMDFEPLHEPNNIFQTLRIMAKNKRKNQKLRFDKSYGEYEFVKRFQNKEKSAISQRSSEYTSKRRSRCDDMSDKKGSNHSLKVYGFDYAKDVDKKPKKREEFIFTYHSSSNSEEDFDPYETVLQYDEF